jgi:hypothetical protein
MDIQVLNEIANPARQASLSQVGASAPANAQLKALKGNTVPAPGNPASPPQEGSPEQTQDPVTPEISSVARAASAYSAAVGDGLNSDELTAIKDLAAIVRTAVSDFLNQPGLEQAENAAAVVASNHDAVQNLTSSLEQVVEDMLRLPEIEAEVMANAVPMNEDVSAEVPAMGNPVSVERITNGAEPNNPGQVIAANPALQNAQVYESVQVETPVKQTETPVESNHHSVPAPVAPEFQENVPSPANSSQSSVEGNSPPIAHKGASVPLGAAESDRAPDAPSTPGPQAAPAPSNELFAQENAAVNPENIRNANELVSAVLESEFTSEAKKIFSETQVIRTVADLADFILERLR